MRKQFASISVTLLMLSVLTVPAGAASSPSLTDLGALMPIDIVVDTQANEIRKVYDLPPNTDPSTLPMAAFERDKMLYECTDILREVIIGNETQVLTQSETVESTKKDLETLLELLPQEKEVTTEDGFAGTLTLDLDSIKSEVSGYGTSSKAVTATHSYPNLSDADTNHIPKTIEDGGRTLTLQDVQWQTDNTYNADDYEIGDRYTAVCTYGGTKSTSYVKGYTTTADYTGEVFRTGVSVIRYTVIFNGVPIEPVEPEQPSVLGVVLDWLMIAFPVLAALGAGIGGTYYFMRRKGRIGYEEVENSGGSYHDDSHVDDDTGSGSGVSD